MRRIGALAYLAVWLTLPAASHAGTPPGYAPIGPPAALHEFAFAADGTVYGTVGGRFWDELPSDPALWRSTDRGRT
jgi:hypothetical protein